MSGEGAVLETPRCTLKRLTAEDAPLMADLGSDPEVVRALIFDWSTAAKRLEVAKYVIEVCQEIGIWGVYDRAGEFGDAGSLVGFIAAEKPLPLGGQGPEIYYAFKQATWNQGVGTEVAGAVIEHLFRDWGVAAVEALVFAGLSPATTRLVERLGMRLVGRYPMVAYVGEECGPTVAFELWRVETATPESAQRCLGEAAIKIGQFVADGFETEQAMATALLRAASANGLVARIGPDAVGETIRTALRAGMAEKGWLHYRVTRDDFFAAQGS